MGPNIISQTYSFCSWAGGKDIYALNRELLFPNKDGWRKSLQENDFHMETQILQWWCGSLRFKLYEDVAV